jgi:hypothetical protein
MKNFILLLALSFSVCVLAQTTVVPAQITPSISFVQYAPSTPLTLVNAIPRTFKWTQGVETTATQDYVVKLTKVSGSQTGVVVTLWGQKFPLKGDSTSLGTFTWKLSSADTVGIISTTSANRYNVLFSTFKGAGTGVSRIDTQALKVYKQ